MCHWFFSTATKARKVVKKGEHVWHREMEEQMENHVDHDADGADVGHGDEESVRFSKQRTKNSRKEGKALAKGAKREAKRKEKESKKAAKIAAKEAKKQAKAGAPEPHVPDLDNMWDRMTEEGRYNFVKAETEYRLTMEMRGKTPILVDVDDPDANTDVSEMHADEQHHLEEQHPEEHHPEDHHKEVRPPVEYNPDYYTPGDNGVEYYTGPTELAASYPKRRFPLVPRKKNAPTNQADIIADCQPPIGLQKEEARKGKGKGKTKKVVKWVYPDEMEQYVSQPAPPPEMHDELELEVVEEEGEEEEEMHQGKANANAKDKGKGKATATAKGKGKQTVKILYKDEVGESSKPPPLPVEVIQALADADMKENGALLQQTLDAMEASPEWKKYEKRLKEEKEREMMEMEEEERRERLEVAMASVDRDLSKEFRRLAKKVCDSPVLQPEQPEHAEEDWEHWDPRVGWALDNYEAAGQTYGIKPGQGRKRR